MRILANTTSMAPINGIVVQTVQVTEELGRRGHHIDLVYEEDGLYRPRYEAFCDSIHQVPKLDVGVRDALRQAPHLVKAVRVGARTHPDVIYLNRFRPLPWALATRGLSRAPVVCHLHGLVGIGTPAVNRNLGRFTSRFLCVSDFVRQSFVNAGGDPGRTEVLHNGIDPAEYPSGGMAERSSARAALGLPEEPVVIFYFGRVTREKGVDVLLEAVAGLAGGSRPIELVLMGPHFEEEYGNDLLDSIPGIPIRHLPTGTDVVTPLHAADVVVVPSIYPDPFPRAVLEAMATGRPVVATATGGIPEALTGDFARFLVPPDDAAALTTALASVLGWREEEPDLGAACTDHIVRHFNKAGMVDVIEQRLEAAAG